MTVKTIEKVPPEGGWGYMVCVGFTIIYSVCMFFTNSLGIIFKDLLEENNGNFMFNVAIGICGILICAAGIVVNVCLKWFTLRKMAIFGAISFTSSWFFNIPLTNPAYLLLTNGFLNGLGFGIMNVISYAVFNSYFMNRRVMMMSICMSVVGIGSIVAPFVVNIWMDNYGYKGTMALVAIVSANTLVGVALFQPVEWHLVPKVVEKAISENEVEKDNIERSPEIESLMHDEKEIKMTDTVVEEANKTTWRKISDHLNLALFKNITFCNICIGTGQGIVSDIMFCTLIPLLLFESGISVNQVAFCVSIISITDLASRIFLIGMGRFVNIRSYYWFYFALFATMAARLMLLQFTWSFICVATILGIIGVLRAWIYILFPLLIAEELPNENYTKSFGLSYVSNGLHSIILSLILGSVKELTGSYVASFYILSLTAVFPLIGFFYEIFSKKSNIKK